MTSRDIVTALASKHSEDVFVPECKDGPTLSRGGSHLRLDAWAMRRSWSGPTTYGYEIKVSRSDFVKDEKWHGYLDLCSQFYFVCPHGLIQPHELPAEPGLYWCSQEGCRLFLKKKAQHRADVQVPETLFRYVLMSRARIIGEFNNNEPRTGEWWKKWLEQGAQDLHTGKLVGKKLRELVSRKIDEVSCENIRLKKELENVAAVVTQLKGLGFDLNAGYHSRYSIEDKVRRLRELIPADLRFSLEQLERQITAVNLQLKTVENNLCTTPTSSSAP